MEQTAPNESVTFACGTLGITGIALREKIGQEVEDFLLVEGIEHSGRHQGDGAERSTSMSARWISMIFVESSGSMRIRHLPAGVSS